MKQKVLLCWNYERKSWVTQFEEILNEDEYYFLNFFSRTQEKTNFSKVKVFYWEDFKSIDHVLAETNPAKVVFMGLEGPYTLLLNYVCKQRGVPTYFLQHGTFHSYEVYKYEEKTTRKIAAEQDTDYRVQHAPLASAKLSFLSNSLTFKRLPVFLRILGFLLFKKLTHSTQRALRFIAGEPVQVDHYIVFTKYLSRIFVQRDKVPERKFIEIGNYDSNRIIDHILHAANYSFTGGDYFLLIDEAFSGSKAYGLRAVVPADKYNDFLVILAEYALSQGKKLKVKLHPFSYAADHFVTHANIEYVKNVDTADLIANCGGVFGFTSTLLIPALFVKRACIFKLNDFSDIHKALTEMHYCKVLDLHDFNISDIEFNDRLTKEQTDAFIKYFLYKLDNKCEERLKIILGDHLPADQVIPI
jgi:hypothetical protein